jgi:hypothetical protein
MERGVEPSGLERVTAGERLLDKFDVDDLGTEALLFQTGYLTITGLVEGGYRLGFPNQEVRLGFLEELWRAADKGLRGPHAQPVAQLGQALSEGRLDQFFELLTGVFAAIPYAQGARLNEANFHTLFYLLVNLAGTSGVAELLNNQGRIDLALERRDRVYVFEFKCGQSADVALHQIRAAGYADRWRGSGKAVVLVGVNFDPQKRNIAEWKTDPEGGDQIPIQRATAR